MDEQNRTTSNGRMKSRGFTSNRRILFSCLSPKSRLCSCT